MFTFGYTLYKVLQEVDEIGKLDLRDAPRNAGIMLHSDWDSGAHNGDNGISADLSGCCAGPTDFRLARPTLLMSVVLTFVAGGFLCIGIVSRLL